MGFLGAIARHFDALVGPGVMLLYPLYASMRAIQSSSALDDQQWLTYWVLYSLITLFELSFRRFLRWFRVWPYTKLLFCLWLVFPIFNGAAYINENFVRKYVMIGSLVSSEYPEGQRKVFQMISLDDRKSVERFIEKYGLDAFERVVEAGSKNDHLSLTLIQQFLLEQSRKLTGQRRNTEVDQRWLKRAPSSSPYSVV